MTVHRVAVLALDGMAPLDLAIPVQIFGPRTETPYQVSVCGPASTVSAASGLALAVTSGLDVLHAADTLIVPGFGPGFSPQPGPLPQAVLDALATARDRGRRVVSICTGAFALAAAGLLDDLHATTHWQYTDELERRFPAVHVERDVLYVDEGNVLTSAGVCCGIDLCLHIVRRDLGAVVANQIARNIVAAPHREGGQAQYVPALVAVTGDTALADTRAWALERLAQPLTVTQLARHARMSERSLMRRFVEETGTTPLKWLVNARLGLARELLETTDQSIDVVASEAGLGSAANLRLHFRRALNTTPTAYRRAFTRHAPQ
ncbi:GlxA family transcriptional regulator [Streptomyces sp. CoH27]|uniref:GlxA family transcriptional regulator n=1 Tax=Streptomyces sp. CoH27 TaxID=2875763 RepID=UPI001CD713E4|nr:helix-turn-helix domain-containing protein [Streptomyces sp. CoH27]